MPRNRYAIALISTSLETIRADAMILLQSDESILHLEF